MITPLIIFILSILIAVISFFFNKKVLAGILSIISIGVNIYFGLSYGLYYSVFIQNNIGNFGFTVNDLNLGFVITILIVTLVTAYYSQRYMQKKFHEMGKENWGLYYGLYSLFAISMLYVVVSINLLELYIFLEIALITSFLLILLYGYGDRRRISLMYFIWTHVGTILTLTSIVVLGLTTGTMDIYSSYGVLNNYSVINYSLLIFVIGVIGMLVKGAIAGFNIWLPYAHGEAPTPISILLSPNMVGLGIFTVMIYFYLFPSLSWLAPIFIGWAVITMIYGGLNAMAQKDFKRFLAYSSVSQMGYMLLGASVGFFVGLKSSVLSLPLGVIASILIYVSHGFGKAILFASAGAAITELEERNIDKLGGLYLISPAHTGLSFIGLLNILGLPPSVGLVSEILLLLSVGQLAGTISLGWLVLLVALLMIAIGISSGYGGYLFKKVYSGIKEFKVNMDSAIEYTIPMAILAFCSVVFFFFPQLLVHSLNNFYGIGSVLASSSYYFFILAFLPAIGSLIALVTPKSLNQDVRGGIVVGLIGISLILAVLNLIRSIHAPLFYPSETYTTFSYFSFSSSLLQAILGVFVSGLSFFIALYSIGYMKEDHVLRRYWGFFGFFVTSMLSVVYSNNLLLFLAGWEGTSLASYGLISYWLDDNERNVVGDFGRRIFGIEYLSTPTNSGIRAMIFTRLADVGLAIGLGYLLFLTSLGNPYFGNMALFDGVFRVIPLVYALPYAWLILFFIMIGGIGKSAQFPLTQWLLTAMTGPTPVSALIHAATMVNLGAILTFFLYPFLVYPSPQTTLLSAIMMGVSLFTAIYTSTNALASNEQKVILAYSTADQISLMILSSSTGAFLASVFNNSVYLTAGILVGLVQMLAHGTYKALLFMNAGSVIHFTENRYTGVFRSLYKRLPSIFILQLIGALNLASIPPLVGFWAHNAIGDLVSDAGLIYLYILVEFLGGFYIVRYIVKTFLWGKGEDVHEEGHIGLTMVTAASILALASIVLGVLYYFFLQPFFGNLGLIYSGFDLPSLLAAVLGFILAFVIYMRGVDFSRVAKPLVDFLYYGWFINPALDVLGNSGYRFAQGVYNKFEYGLVDMSLNVKLPRSLVGAGGVLVSKTNTGVLRDYVGLYIAGFVVLIVIVLLVVMVM